MGVLPWCMVGAWFTIYSQLPQGYNSHGMQKHIKKVHLSLSWALQGAQIHLSSIFRTRPAHLTVLRGEKAIPVCARARALELRNEHLKFSVLVHFLRCIGRA